MILYFRSRNRTLGTFETEDVFIEVTLAVDLVDHLPQTLRAGRPVSQGTDAEAFA